MEWNMLSRKKELSEDGKVLGLKQYDLLKGLRKRELRQINNLLVERRYKKGEVIYKKGYPHTVLYFVAEGDVLIYLEKDGDEIELLHKKPFEHFGEVGLFMDMNRTASARAVEDTILLSLTKKNFNEFVRNSSKIGVKIMSNISAYLCRMLVKNNQIITNLHNQINENTE